MKDSRLCYYDVKLGCWVEEKYKTRWEPKHNQNDKNIGVAHQAFGSKDGMPCVALYATPTSVPMFIADISNPNSALDWNDLIWKYQKGANGLVSSRDRTIALWIPDSELQHIPFRMIFDLNKPENAEVRHIVNVMLSEPEFFYHRQRYDRRINLSLDKLELIGLPDSFLDLFFNLRTLAGTEGAPTHLEKLFTDGYHMWTSCGYPEAPL